MSAAFKNAFPGGGDYTNILTPRSNLSNCKKYFSGGMVQKWQNTAIKEELKVEKIVNFICHLVKVPIIWPESTHSLLYNGQILSSANTFEQLGYV